MVIPGGLPANSTAAVDTIFYPKKGSYTMSLFVSQSDGSGTTSISKKIEINENAAQGCSDKLSLLTGECFPQGRCWTFTREAGAVKVGPTYDDYSWYTAPAGGLQDAQYDDGFVLNLMTLFIKTKTMVPQSIHGMATRFNH
ncbi:MAG: hypothetical protein IPH94_15995 [Saprospiraceae bacterium]|nr:hypothetical protein [Saprospiraceae bacterium]